MNEKFIVSGLLIAYAAVIGVVCWDSKKNPSRVVASKSKDYYQGIQKGMVLDPMRIFGRSWKITIAILHPATINWWINN